MINYGIIIGNSSIRNKDVIIPFFDGITALAQIIIFFLLGLLSFPHMIELFSKRPDYLSTLVTRLGSIHISDDVISLSAILLDDEYYELLKNGVVEVESDK